MSAHADMFAAALQHHQLGRVTEAEQLYRRILDGNPNHVGSLNFLGVAAHQGGRHDEAIELIGRAIALNDSIPDCHNSLGEALRASGRFDEAIPHYEKAIALDPAFAEAHNNLGIVLSARGDTDAAIAAFRRALSFEPKAPQTQANLATALRQCGRLDESIAAFRAAIALQPKAFDLQHRLGQTLMQHGQIDEAVQTLRHALTLQPDSAVALQDLAGALLAQGEAVEAADAAHRALRAEETPDTRAMFVQIITALRDPPEIDGLDALLVRALTEPWGRPGDLARVAANVLKRDAEIGPLVDRFRAPWPIAMFGDLNTEEIATLARSPLLSALLVSGVIWDADLERLFTVLRRTMLKRAFASQPGDPSDPAMPLWCALARQCFINEYVYSRDHEEMTGLAVLWERLNKALAEGGPIVSLWPVSIGAYGPLHALRDTDALLERAWREPERLLLAQQVRNPRAEADDRSAIPRLTAVDDEISRAVRQQYEENPYPCWVKTVPTAPVSLDVALRGQFPLSPFQPLGKGDAIDLLIAGCGTGQHAIETAQRFPQARIVAIDLSLSSLAYARRQARQAKIGNIVFAQADILNLGKVEQTFDVIEVSGVLHHMADPLAGLQALLGVLRPGGLIRVGLYSQAARAAVTAVRDEIATRGYGSSPDEIRRCRQELMQQPAGSPQHHVTLSPDFYATSACRDLLFHAQEQQLTLPDLKAMLGATGLSFLGFEHDAFVLDRYRRRFPDDPSLTDLDKWHAFEIDNPQTFGSMYQFWAQKGWHDGASSPT